MTFFLFSLLGEVFHVTDLNGNKLTDESVISYIEQVIKMFLLFFLVIKLLN